MCERTEVADKLHFAISGHTAAELIYERANSEKEHMGLTNWKNSPDGLVYKYDVSIAKNYLNEEEMSKLNNLTNKEELKYEFFGYLSSDNITEQNGYIKYSTENDYNIDRFSKIIRNIGIEDFDINVNGKIFCVEFSNQIKENIV